MLQNLQEYSVVAKVNVSNLAASVVWYESKLDMVTDPAYQRPTWEQLNFPGKSGFAVGLNLDADHVGTGGASTTFVVTNIEAARNELISRGVEVSPVQNAEGVLLAFFSDPDGNSLGLRQN